MSLRSVRDYSVLHSIVEENTSTQITYIGYSYPGDKKTDPKWIIKKVSETTVGDIVTTESIWADNDNSSFKKKWSERASYSYEIE